MEPVTSVGGGKLNERVQKKGLRLKFKGAKTQMLLVERTFFAVGSYICPILVTVRGGPIVTARSGPIHDSVRDRSRQRTVGGRRKTDRFGGLIAGCSQPMREEHATSNAAERDQRARLWIGIEVGNGMSFSCCCSCCFFRQIDYQLREC